MVELSSSTFWVSMASPFLQVMMLRDLCQYHQFLDVPSAENGILLLVTWPLLAVASMCTSSKALLCKNADSALHCMCSGNLKLFPVAFGWAFPCSGLHVFFPKADSAVLLHVPRHVGIPSAGCGCNFSDNGSYVYISSL